MYIPPQTSSGTPSLQRRQIMAQALIDDVRNQAEITAFINSQIDEMDKAVYNNLLSKWGSIKNFYNDEDVIAADQAARYFEANPPAVNDKKPSDETGEIQRTLEEFLIRSALNGIAITFPATRPIANYEYDAVLEARAQLMVMDVKEEFYPKIDPVKIKINARRGFPNFLAANHGMIPITTVGN